MKFSSFLRAEKHYIVPRRSRSIEKRSFSAVFLIFDCFFEAKRRPTNSEQFTTMKWLFLLTLPLAGAFVSHEHTRSLVKADDTPYGPGNPCPCSDESLCAPLKTNRFDDGKEFFIFHVPGYGEFNDEWRQYNWDRITSVSLWQFVDSDAEFYCYAKSLGVRIFVQASPERAAYATNNETAKLEWVDNVLSDVQGYFADGINMDTEDDIAPMNKTVQKGLTDMAVRAKSAFVENDLADVLVTFDVGWSPNADGRFYDYEGLAEASDFLVIMAYDMASYIWGACLATPNSPPAQVLQGLLQWMSVTTPDKLVLAVPWYGRSYECTEGTKVTDRYCPIAAAPWRDCNCTDADSGVIDYTAAYNSNLTKVKDDILQNTYYNNVVNGTGE